jgi:histidyl-tRNA synthetase
MRDWLPQETLLRQKLIRLIEHHYQLYGFQPIDTPVMENIEVLQGKGGGDNEKLMFGINRRGDDFSQTVEEGISSGELNALFALQLMRLKQRLKEIENLDNTDIFNVKKGREILFELAKARTRKDLEEKILNDLKEIEFEENQKNLIAEAEKQIKVFENLGLRFDLTVPLARYYANHSNELPKPFRCYHIGPVWRADRPQKGRFREFYQCDIDIIGGTSDAYEVELLLATDRVLKELNVGNFKIRISDKRLLPDLLTGMGVEASKVAGVAGALDKLDKQPKEEVWKEIEALGHSLEVLNKVDGFLKNALNKQVDPVHFKIGQAEKLWLNIESIRQRVHAVNPEANVVFDPLLVRGFDYYTGPVFEINVESKDFTFSIGGGGRYDGLIEKLGGPKGTPAVGISLGFERILMILMEKAKGTDQIHSPRIFIANNSQPEKDILALAEQLRSEGIQVEASLEGNKKLGQQLEAAQKNGIEYAITKFTPGTKSYTVRKLSTRDDREMPLAELYDIMKRLSEEIED